GSDTTFLIANSCFPSDTGWANVVLVNQNGCDSVIATYTDYILSDTTYVFLISCNPIDTGILIQLLTNQIGCDSIVITQTELGPGLLINAVIDSMYGGFGVPCFGDKVGIGHVEILSEGTGPYSVDWSTGDTNFVVSNLSSGKYLVFVTDANNCSAADSFQILEPQPLSFEIDTFGISCFSEQDGSVIITKVEGGVFPWMSSLNGSPYQSNLSYESLDAGNYNLLIRDANGCIVQEEFTLVQPDAWSIELGSDTTVTFGANILIEPEISGLPSGMLQYLWSDDKCENCIARSIEINSDIQIQLVVTDNNGCTASDIINFKVVIPEKIYIPNVISPNGDQVNDEFFISTNPFIELIDELSIFDRWGNMVFQKFNFIPNDPTLGWDGQMDEKPLNPDVFAYKVIVSFKDGSTKVFHGDVTLVR
ncbi:MAG TPA: gliding motility-associated C-terminal domain-containing protein, partial [Saprospiraceae bacterium]|nr:gliding motility-associated C-terminal domain-containing protein [Saprospiraceae bacterium]